MPAEQSNAAVRDLQPAQIWDFFAAMSAVPRPSKREERIREHILSVAQEHSLAARTDDAGNVIIDVPASKGRDQAPVTVLQAHLDMVCEKNNGVPHDFDRDPIKLLRSQRDGEPIIHADGTTLGADNGIGVAMALAAATSPDVVHGPLELLLTIDEEDGMSGAKALTPDSFRGRRMLNLDSEEDNVIYIGSAGGCDTNFTWREDAIRAPRGLAVKISITGLRGGHSGSDIHENRASANELLVRLLRRVPGDPRLVEVHGGNKRNAIAREASAVIVTSENPEALKRLAKTIRDQAVAESYEQGIAIDVAEAEKADGAIDVSGSRRILDALSAIHHGVFGMHPKVPGLVQTSNNLSILSTRAGASKIEIHAGTMSRSSSDSRLQNVLDAFSAVGRLSGATVEFKNHYAGWEPNPDSPLLATAKKVYERLFSEAPKVAAIHAGLECGIIGKCVGGMDMISIGPRIEGAHSPDERVYPNSVARSWRMLTELLGELSRV